MVFGPALFTQYVMVFMAQLGMGIVAPALPVLQEQFQITTGEVALILAVFGMARLASDVPVGLLADRVPRVSLLIAGLASMASGAAVCAVAPTFPILLGGRILMGLGSSLVYTTSQVILVARTIPRERGRAMGFYQGASLVGIIMSPAIGGVITAFFGWREAFWFCVLMTGAATVLASVARGLLDRPLESRSQQAIASDPQPKKLLNQRAMLAIQFVSFSLFFAGQGVMNTWVPLYGGRVLQLSPIVLGTALGLAGAVRLLVSLVGGIVSDHLGRRAVLAPALFVLGAGTAILALAHDAMSFIMLVTLCGVGRLGNGVPATLLADLTPRDRLGATLGFNRFVGDFGVAIGPLLVGWLIEAVGYAEATWVVAVVIWASALALLGWVPESLPRARPARQVAQG